MERVTLPPRDERHAQAAMVFFITASWPNRSSRWTGAASDARRRSRLTRMRHGVPVDPANVAFDENQTFTTPSWAARTPPSGRRRCTPPSCRRRERSLSNPGRQRTRSGTQNPRGRRTNCTSRRAESKTGRQDCPARRLQLAAAPS
jgi:hypothetical protein